MGYQESYVTINGNVDELISIIQKLGKNHFDYTIKKVVNLFILLAKEVVRGIPMPCLVNCLMNYQIA